MSMNKPYLSRNYVYLIFGNIEGKDASFLWKESLMVLTLHHSVDTWGCNCNRAGGRRGLPLSLWGQPFSMLPFGIEKENLRHQKERILPKIKQELQDGEVAHDVWSKVLPWRKKRGKGEKFWRRVPEPQVAEVPKFTNYQSPSGGRKLAPRSTILEPELELKKEGSREKQGAFWSQMAYFA